MSEEVILAYEIALRALDVRDLETTRLFIEIAKILRSTEPLAKRRFRLTLPHLPRKQPQTHWNRPDYDRRGSMFR